MCGMNLVKKQKQHYVWRHYLSKWSISDKIWCLRNNEIFPSGLMGVGNIRFFYKLNELTEEDIKLIRLLYIDKMDPMIQDLNRNWIEIFTAVQRLRVIAQSTGQFDKIQKEIDVLTYNFEEDIHGTYESITLPILEKIYNKDLSFIDGDEYYTFNTYLCEQYFRTNARKEAQKKIQNNFPQIDTSRIWNVSAHILATMLSFGIVREKQNLRYALLENTTELEFITGDQPVINTYAKPESLNPLSYEEFELYYPITPKLALLITHDKKVEHKSINIISKDDAEKYNDLIFRNSYEQIYGTSIDVLNKYKI
jgi:hypothetical protein